MERMNGHLSNCVVFLYRYIKFHKLIMFRTWCCGMRMGRTWGPLTARNSCSSLCSAMLPRYVECVRMFAHVKGLHKWPCKADQVIFLRVQTFKSRVLRQCCYCLNCLKFARYSRPSCPVTGVSVPTNNMKVTPDIRYLSDCSGRLVNFNVSGPTICYKYSSEVLIIIFNAFY